MPLEAARMTRVRPSPSTVAAAKARELRESGVKVLDLTVGEPDFDTPDNVKHAGIAAIERGDTKYTAVNGTAALRRAIIERLRRVTGIDYTDAEISVGSGAKHVIFTALMATLSSGDEVGDVRNDRAHAGGIRSKQGVEPTEAGAALYRHAQVILKQLDDAVAEVGLLGREVAGQVFVGLAPYSTANLIALPLVKAVRAHYPHVRLRVVDNFGLVLSEAMMTGRLHLAILYDSGPIKGLVFERLITEELVLVCAPDYAPDGDQVTVEALAEVPLMLPSPLHTIRKAVDAACASAGIQPMLTAELESVGLMGQAVSAGLGATVLPRSVAERLTDGSQLRLIRIVPGIEVHLSLGTPSSLPLSRAAECVREVLRHVVADSLLARR